MILLLEGCDKTGKTTLHKNIHEATDYKHVIFERGFASGFVYNTIMGRSETNLEYYLKYDRLLSPYVLLIYLYADPETLKVRFEKENEDFISSDKINEILFTYQYYFNFSYCNRILIDTSRNSKEEACNQVISFIKQYENNSDKYFINNLLDQGEQNDTTLYRRNIMFRINPDDYNTFDSKEFQHYSEGIAPDFRRMLHKIKLDNQTRQAYLSIWDKFQFEIKRPNCIIGLNFFIENNKINMTVIQRSSDIKKLESDLGIVSIFLKIVAEALDKGYGYIDVFYLNIHKYLKD